MRMATPPVFWVQKVAGTSMVRRKWSHRTLPGSPGGGHASGTGVDMTNSAPLQGRFGFDWDTVPLDGLAAPAGIETAETIGRSPRERKATRHATGPVPP